MNSCTVQIITLLFCLGAATPTLDAQRCGDLTPGLKPGWGPRSLPSTYSGRPTAADLATINATLKAAEQLVRQTVHGTSHGLYEAEPWWRYGVPASRTRLSEYRFEFVLACPTFRAVGGDAGPVVTIVFNPGPQQWSEGDRPILAENGESYYVERIRSEPQFGSTATFGKLVERNGAGLHLLFTAGGESPTLPVSREEYLRATIFTLEGSSPAPKKSAYESWLEGAADRKKAREETLAIIAATDPAKAGQMRKDLEKAEHDPEELYRRGEEAGRAHPPGEQYRAQLAAMSPTERASPAFVAGLDLVPAGSPIARAVVRENPAFYRARRSPVEPRAALVYIPQSTYEALENQRQQMYQEFDWAALKRIVNEHP